jgi:glyoxylate reductase
MPKPTVFVTRHLPGGALDFLRGHCTVRLWDGELPPSPQELREGAADAGGLLTLLTDRVDRDLLASAPGLLVVSNMATGFDNIDLAGATQRSVLVTRTPGVLSETTADFAFALLLAAARRVVEGDRYARAGRWKTWGPEVLLGHDVHGATIGIIGMGGIGEEVAKRARGFGMRIVHNSCTPKPALEKRYRMNTELMRWSANQIGRLHRATHSRDARESMRPPWAMKPTAVLVNTARGPLDQERCTGR